MQVASEFGQEGDNLAGDVTGDGIVYLFDLVTVGSHFGETIAAAPSLIDFGQMAKDLSIPDYEQVHHAIIELEAMVNPPQGAKIALAVLRAWLMSADTRVVETKVLSNYPNPFNPNGTDLTEKWLK